MKTTFNFFDQFLFPWHFRFLGLVFFLMGLYLFLESPYIASLLLAIGLLLVSGYRGIQFDKSKMQFREYNSFFLFKFGKWQKYDGIKKIYVTTSTIGQKIYTQITTGPTIKNEIYKAWLKFNDQSTLFLSGKKNEIALRRKLKKLSEFLEIE